MNSAFPDRPSVKLRTLPIELGAESEYEVSVRCRPLSRSKHPPKVESGPCVIIRSLIDRNPERLLKERRGKASN